MSVSWPEKPLGEICEVLDSKRKPITKCDRLPGEYPYYGATGILDYVEDYIFDEQLILIGEDGAKWDTGETSAFIAKGKYWVNNHAHVIRPNRSVVLDNWMVYFLNHSNLLNFVTGLTVPKLNQEKMRSIPIPLPPLPEQKRIVAILDEAFSGIARAKEIAEKNLANASSLFESTLYNTFENSGRNWQIKKVSEIAKHSLGKMLDKAKNKGEPQTYLRNLNVRWFAFELSDLLQMPFQTDEFEKYTVKKGDVLICEGGYPGRAAIWNEDYQIHFQKALHRVRFHETTHNRWFVYYLYSQDKCGKLRQHFNGTGIQHFTGEVLHEYQIPMPPADELKILIGMFDELFIETGRLAAVYQKKINSLESLKKSLLQKAFTGELTR